MISSFQDTDGNNATCQENIDWSHYGKQAKFIWREDLQLDNRLLCRYTLQQQLSATPSPTPDSAAAAMFLSSFSLLLSLAVATLLV